MLKILRQINLKLTSIAILLTKVLFSVMFCSVVIDVFYRYVFNSPLTWPNGVARYSLIWISCLTGGVIIKEHVKLDFLLNALSASNKRKLTIINDIFILTFLFIIIYEGILRALVLRGTTMPFYSHCSMFWVYLAYPCFGFLGSLKIIEDFLEKMKYKSLKESNYDKAIYID